MVELRAALAWAARAPGTHPRRKLACHQGDQEQEDDGGDVFGAVDVEGTVGLGEEVVEGQGGRHRGKDPRHQAVESGSCEHGR